MGWSRLLAPVALTGIRSFLRLEITAVSAECSVGTHNDFFATLIDHNPMALWDGDCRTAVRAFFHGYLRGVGGF